MKEWLKLYRKMLFDRNYRNLSDVGRLGFTEMLLAADDYGRLYDVDRTAYLLHREPEWVDSAIRELTAAGWLERDGAGYAWRKWSEYQESPEARRKRHQREREQRDGRDERDKCHTGHQEGDRDQEREGDQELTAECVDTHLSLAEPPTTGKSTPCPHQEIIAAYHETLPMCPQVKSWGPPRQALLRSRWNESRQRQSVDVWREFFEYVSQSDFLTGKVQTPDRTPFVASLEWLVRPRNFAKVIEGQYHRKAMSKAELRSARNREVIERVERSMRERRKEGTDDFPF